jgi:hypothetical protein
MPWSSIIVDQSAKLVHLFKLQTSVGCLGFICFLIHQLHKGKYKISKENFIYQRPLYTSAHWMLQVIYLEVEPMAKRYGMKIDVLLGTPKERHWELGDIFENLMRESWETSWEYMYWTDMLIVNGGYLFSLHMKLHLVIK